jgi:uncharacterized protein
MGPPAALAAVEAAATGPRGGRRVMLDVARAGPGTQRRAPRRGGIPAATIAAGAALAVLVGHDGTASWQIVRVVVVALATAAVLAAERQLGDRGCGRLAAAVGVPAMAVGAGFLPYAVKDGASLVAAAGLVELVAGAVLAAAGTVLGTRGRRMRRRFAAGAGTLVVAGLVLFVVGPAVAATNVPRPDIGATPASRGLAYESVTLTTDDGVRLAGWYVVSTNGAAVVLLHGAGSTRSDVLDEAAVLARHGFGVLLVDARGHGGSGGRAMDFGWHGDADIAAATRYVADRPDVDRDRIAVVGLSMGGEEALGASATDELITAVVAEGATARTAADEAWLSDEFGLRGRLQEQLEQLQDQVTDELTSATVPTSSRAAVEASGDTRYLLITAGAVPDEGHAADHIAAGAPERVQIWTVPGAGHSEGLKQRPEQWEERVIDFLTESLSPSRGPDVTTRSTTPPLP